MWRKLGTALIVCVAVIALAVTYADAKDTPKAKTVKPAPPTLSIVTQDGKTHKFKIEIANTESERRRGLMNRETLKKDAGMLFVFDRTSFQVFWMKDTLIPLDIIFIDEKGRITKITQGKPNDLTPLPSDGPVRAALEILGGQSAALGIKKGDLVKYSLFTK